MQSMTIWIVAAGLWLSSVGAEAAPLALRAQAEAFAGRPVLLDPRVQVPACAAAIAVHWRDAAERVLVATCVATGWRLVIPVAGVEREAVSQPVVRRGEPVTVRAGGAGFTVRMEAVSEGEGRPGGRVLVRNLRTGERFAAEIGADGQLWLAGQGGQL